MNSLGSRFLALVRDMAPANFAMVMSTGIISVDLARLGSHAAAWFFHGVNAFLYASLCALLLLRICRWPGLVAADFASHHKGPGFLTLVAGTSIFGTQTALLAKDTTLAGILFVLAAACWVFILWGVFFAIFTRVSKPCLGSGINGAWLVATVSTESLVILGATLGAPAWLDAGLVYFGLSALFSAGVVLYLFVITGIFFRFCFTDMTAEEFDPTYWINASAAASTALAGTALMGRAGAAPVMAMLLPYISGLTLLAWAAASWWVPMLLLIGFWRHVVWRYPFTYSPAYWSMVFPLGMYTACTFAMSDAYGVPGLMVIPRVFVLLALAAWGTTLAGMLYSRGRTLFTGAPPGS